jgi:hypothetical protein
MIVYNVERRWFTEKDQADAYRIAQKFKPAALLKVFVETRQDLAALLNALCDPGAVEVLAIADKHGLDKIKSAILVDRAYVKPKALTGKDIPDCVPTFLLRAYGVER